MDVFTLPHIAFEYPEAYQDEFVLKDIEPLQEHGLMVDSRKRDLGLMATIEWAIPTAFVVYLLKPYFESFLAEAGKDSYVFVRKKLTQFITNKRKMKTVLLSATQSINKLSKSYDQSHTISIHSRVHDNVRITVLFNNDLDEKIFKKAVSGAIDSLAILHDKFEKLDKGGKSSTVIDYYMIMNVQQKTWELLSYKQMTEKYQNL